jgi:flagellar hook assembly protein FlgD
MESEPSEIVEEWTVDTDNDTVPSLKTKLLGNYPNPFNPAGTGRSSTTTIEFIIAERSPATDGNTEKNTELIIYNIKGQKVKTLYKGKIETGKHSVVWDGKDENDKPVSSGLYLYKLEAGKYNSIKKMLLIK